MRAITLIYLICGAALMSPTAATPGAKKVGPDCSYQGFMLNGKIQFVESFPDLKVQAVDSFPDLKVKIVNSFPDNCGEWQIVDSFPDLKIKMVDSFPDFKIKFVNSFPGIP